MSILKNRGLALAAANVHIYHRSPEKNSKKSDLDLFGQTTGRQCLPGRGCFMYEFINSKS